MFFSIGHVIFFVTSRLLQKADAGHVGDKVILENSFFKETPTDGGGIRSRLPVGTPQKSTGT